MSDGVLSIGYRRGKVEAFIRRYKTHLLVPVLGAAAFACALSLWVASPATPSLRMFVGPLLVAVGLGLLTGFLVAVISDASNPSVRVARDAAKATGYDVLGVIPSRARRSSPALVAVTDPHSPAAAAYRHLASRMVDALPNSQNGGVLITGVRAADSSTLTAANVAVATALDGHSTVMVDLDLAAPNLHYLFSVDNNFGISQVLAGGPLSEAVRPIARVPHLAVVPAGNFNATVAERIDGRRLDRVMLELRRRFDVVILAATSLLDSPEPFVMPAYCDGVMLVLSSRASRKKDARAAADKLDHASARVIGSAITDYRSDLNGPTVERYDASAFRRNQHRVRPAHEPLIAVTRSAAVATPPARSAPPVRPATWTPPRGQSNPAAKASQPVAQDPVVTQTPNRVSNSTGHRAPITGEIPRVVHTTLDMPRTPNNNGATRPTISAFQPPAQHPLTDGQIAAPKTSSTQHPPSAQQPAAAAGAHAATLGSAAPSAGANASNGIVPERRVSRPSTAANDEAGAIPRPVLEATPTASQARVLQGLQVRLERWEPVPLDPGMVVAPAAERASGFDDESTPSEDTREIFRYHDVVVPPPEQPVSAPTQVIDGRQAPQARSGGEMSEPEERPTWLSELYRSADASHPDAPGVRRPRETDDVAELTGLTPLTGPPSESPAADLQPIPPTESVVASAVVVPLVARSAVDQDRSPAAHEVSGDADCVGFAPKTVVEDDTPSQIEFSESGTDDDEVAAPVLLEPPVVRPLPPPLRPSKMGAKVDAKRRAAKRRAAPTAAKKRSPVKKSPPARPPTKKTATKKASAAGKAAAKKSTSRKTAAKKPSSSKKPATKVTAAKKAPSRAPSKTSAASRSKATPHKSTAKKSGTKKSGAKKPAASKPSTKKSVAKKPAAKKPAAKKATAKAAASHK